MIKSVESGKLKVENEASQKFAWWIFLFFSFSIFNSQLSTVYAQPVPDSPAYPGQGVLWSPGMGKISDFDYIIRPIAREWGYDWRFISAIAMAESRFNPNARSRAGAVGLMQIMPVTARNFKVDARYIDNPFLNVSLAVELLDQIYRTLHFPKWVGERDRLSIVLAAYNAGLTHVLDARRLAVKNGENHNSWEVVAKYLELKIEPEYYEDETVRAGRFSGSAQTLGYVDKVMGYYNGYLKTVPF